MGPLPLFQFLAGLQLVSLVFDSVGQTSFFTAKVGRSSDPQVEQAFLEVRSYGRQLGRIGEALLAIAEQRRGSPLLRSPQC